MIVTSYFPIEQKTNDQILKAVVGVEIPQWKMKIEGIKELKKGESKWYSLPSYSVEIEGERKYFPCVSFDKEAEKRFLQKIRELVSSHLEKG